MDYEAPSPAAGVQRAAGGLVAQAAARAHPAPRLRQGAVPRQGDGGGGDASGRQDDVPAPAPAGTHRAGCSPAAVAVRLVRGRAACGPRRRRPRPARVRVRPRIPGRGRRRAGGLALRRDPGRRRLGAFRPAAPRRRTHRGDRYRLVRRAPVARGRDGPPRPRVASADSPLQLRRGALPPGAGASGRCGRADGPGADAARTRTPRLARRRRLPRGAGARSVVAASAFCATTSTWPCCATWSSATRCAT